MSFNRLRNISALIIRIIFNCIDKFDTKTVIVLTFFN